MQEEKKSFKEQVLELVQGMKEDEFDFENDAAIFNWEYDELPELQFQMVIFAKGTVPDDDDDDSQLAFDFGESPDYLH